MEYKTPMIAEKMGVSPKVVMRIVQQLNLEIKKNKFGHYVFNEEDVQKIMANYSACEETAAAISPSKEEASSPSPEPLRAAKQREMPYLTSEQFYILKRQMDEMEQRLFQNEEHIRQKADNVVQYQLLQHRNEIEELQRKVEELQVSLQQLETRKQQFNPVPEYSAAKPKRRSMIFNILGL